jgi:hypothetical protein
VRWHLCRKAAVAQQYCSSKAAAKLYAMRVGWCNWRYCRYYYLYCKASLLLSLLQNNDAVRGVGVVHAAFNYCVASVTADCRRPLL